jgi:DNA-binding NtrC family response regulator
MNEGLSGFVMKPYRIEQLAQAVSDALRQAERTAEPR